MRLLIAAIAVVAGFVIGVLGIARLTPDNPDWLWLRLTLAALWIFGLIAGVFLLSNKGRERGSSIALLVGGAILSALLALIVFAVEKLPISPIWQRRLVYAVFLAVAFGIWSVFNRVLWLKIYRAKRQIKRLVRQVCPKANVFSFGATDIDPKHLAIWITTPTDAERDRLRSQPDLVDTFRTALLDSGYPPDAIPKLDFQFESQETVDREYGGSWYRATK